MGIKEVDSDGLIGIGKTPHQVRAGMIGSRNTALVTVGLPLTQQRVSDGSGWRAHGAEPKQIMAVLYRELYFGIDPDYATLGSNGRCQINDWRVRFNT